MSDSPTPTTDPEDSLQREQSILNNWREFSPARQVSLIIALLDEVMESGYRDVLLDTIEARWPREINAMERLFPITSMSRADLQRNGIHDEIIDQLDDQDMQKIARKLDEHYVDHDFWEHLAAVVDRVLERKSEQETTYRH